MGEESQDEITVLEYGQYALIGVVAESILSSLKKHFQIQGYYEQSWLSQEYKGLPFRMGKTALGTLFVIDRGSYSSKNLKILSANDNTYIISVPSNTDAFRETMKDVKYTDSFYCRSGKKHACIEHTFHKISDTEYIYVFRDIDENEKCRYNYQHCIELGRSGYTQERLEQNKENFGVYVLQSNAAKTAEEIFAGYKKRCGIETFYQYLKNIGDFNDLMIQDYYKEQGFSFIMLITGQIHQKMISAVKTLDDNTISAHDILLMARCLKMERRGNNWNLKNTRKRDLQILMKLGFEPKLMVPDIVI